MCVICGCGEATVEEAHTHNHDHHHHHDHAPLDFGAAHSQPRSIAIERDILAKNDVLAAQNRARLHKAGVFSFNLMASPGAGKTALLERAIKDLASRQPIAVVEGDQQTAHDAERIRAAGAEAVQINTGKGCHLDAHMVAHALDHLTLGRDLLLAIENVGNLVCPAGFDLGEAVRVVMFSVTEGEDKPLKYPAMFQGADLVLLSKIDLLPYLDFDTEAALAAARRVNPRLQILPVSAKTGEGMAAFYAWIEARAAAWRI